MECDGRFITWATECTESLLAPLGDRWFHVRGALERARWVGKAFDDNDCFA